jgi:hypothetical protein
MIVSTARDSLRGLNSNDSELPIWMNELSEVGLVFDELPGLAPFPIGS